MTSGTSHRFKADAGGRGLGSRKHGRAGDDMVLTVPPGTAVFDDATEELLADLVEAGQEAQIARGGRGGLGNTHFKSSTHQAPKHAQSGEPGEERWLRLELRLIADIGLVGLPNAGKSTLLAALTAATPKIADYPFTTLEPNLGVLDLDGDDERRPTIADVPGLIEGASLGAGLGHAFLRHVERTRILVHVVDGSGRDPEWSFGVIQDELEAHDSGAPRQADARGVQQARPARRARGLAGVPEGPRARPSSPSWRSPPNGATACPSCGPPWPACSRRPRSSTLPASRAGVVVHRIEGRDETFHVDRDADGVLRVRGKRIERIAAQTDFDIEESAERFQRDLARLGVDAELRRAGVVSGDLVRIGGVELEWDLQPWEVG